jgi:hypothetical protein
MRKARRYFVLVIALAVLMLSACAVGPNEMVDTGTDPAGFWQGLWQGLISPITFLISLFTPDVNIYEVQNNGNWYGCAFMLGVVMAFGGGAGGGTALAGRYRRAGPSLGGCVALMGLVDHLLVVWLSSTKITRCSNQISMSAIGVPRGD